MAFPDIATLVVVTAASNALVAVSMGLMHRAKPQAGYFHLLAIGAAGAFLGWCLYSTRLLSAPPWLAFVVANLLIALYPAMLLLAVRRFLDLPGESRWRRGVLLGMALLGLALSLALGTRLHMVVVATLGNALLYSLAALVLVRHGLPFSLSGAAIFVAAASSATVLWLRLGSTLAAGAPAQDPLLISLSLIIPLLGSLMFALAFPIGEFRRDEERLRALSERDMLTGLPNRSLALAQLQRALDQRQPLSLAFIDLDGFKRINDSLGHATGDALLAAVATRMRDGLRDGEQLARFGGDEFLLLLPGDPGAAEQRTRVLLASLRAPFAIAGREVVIAGSVGLSAYPADADDARDLLQLADIALYQAKRQARGDVCRYTPALGAAAQVELAIELELRAAMASGRIVLALQPRRRLADGLSHAAEALVRLRREDGTLMLPTVFLPVAERCGLLPQLGALILTEAVAALATLRRQPALADFRLSVNLSPVELQVETLAARVAGVLRAQAIPASALEIELTETALIDDPRLAAERLAELQALGIAIALDDFGAGYSGLSHLLRFPISVLKIDRSFIEGLRRDDTADALVESLIALAKRLGLHVVAEGIEDVGLLDALRALGCDEAQGFAIAPPMPLDALQHWLLAEAPSARAIGVSAG